MDFDFDVWVRGLERFLGGIENFLTTLDDDDAGDAGFGERLADGIADTGRCMRVKSE